jgi:hypothetical protein
MAANVPLARSQQARRTAHKKLAETLKEADAETDGAYQLVSQALSSYLADKLNLSAAGLTRDMIARQLESQEIPVDLIHRALDILDWADSGRFAPVAGGRTAADLVGEARNVIDELEGWMT